MLFARHCILSLHYGVSAAPNWALVWWPLRSKHIKPVFCPVFFYRFSYQFNVVKWSCAHLYHFLANKKNPDQHQINLVFWPENGTKNLPRCVLTFKPVLATQYLSWTLYIKPLFLRRFFVHKTNGWKKIRLMCPCHKNLYIVLMMKKAKLEAKTGLMGSVIHSGAVCSGSPLCRFPVPVRLVRPCNVWLVFPLLL